MCDLMALKRLVKSHSLDSLPPVGRSLLHAATIRRVQYFSATPLVRYGGVYLPRSITVTLANDLKRSTILAALVCDIEEMMWGSDASTEPVPDLS